MKLDGGVIYTQIEDQFPQFIQYDHPKFVKFVEKYYEFLETNLITFTDLNLNEFKIIQESDAVTYTVTIQLGSNEYGNGTHKFYLNDDVSPTVTLNTGTTYVFDMSSNTFANNHYFHFSTTPNGIHTAGGEIYTDNVRIDGTPGEAGAQTVIYIPPDLAGSTLYYFCNTHSGMGGNVTISNTTPYFSLENGNTDSANTSTDYLDLENPFRQGEQFYSGEVVKGSTSGARAVIRGKYSNNQIYVHETNNGNFQVGETIVGQTSRVSANVSSWTRQPNQASRNVIPFQDVDLAPQGFLELFRKEFLHGIPTTMLADKGLVLKHIKDFYRAKGNEESFRFIFRILFGNENVNFYYPSTDVLRLSDGRWTLDKSVKLETLSANNVDSFVGRVIVGQTSNVRAIVERSENYQIGATPITELFLSNIDANNSVNATSNNSQYTSFAVNEVVVTETADDNGNYGSGTITGLLASVNIDAGGSNYTVGDDIIVTGGGGQEGAVKVGSVSDATISSFDIIDAGDGYAVGDPITFTNEGTGGTGGSARVQSIIPTTTILTAEQIINTFKDDQIGATGYTLPWTSYTCNTHLYSNVQTTFTASFTGTAPKKGDFIITVDSFFSAENGDTFILEQNTDRLKREHSDTVSNYSPSTSVYGTVIAVDGTAVTYAVGSITYDGEGTAEVNNFANGDEITVYDLTKNASGTAKNASSNDAVFYSTGSTFTLSNTPNPETSNTYYGALTMTGTQVGAIRSIQVLSSGQGYRLIPVVTVANTVVSSYFAAPDKTGANSIFLTLSSAIANQFTANTVIKNDNNTANGVVLDFIDRPTSLVETGNTVLRVQMTTANNFASGERITAYVNEAGGNPVGIGNFFVANVSTTDTTATFTASSHGLSAGQKIVVTSVSTGVSADDSIYNNTHSVTAVTNTSTFTVSLGSAPTTTSVTEALGRRVVTANTSTTNTVFANTGIPGNNAVISISAIAIGAIQSLTIYNFGANYTSAPTLDASQAGDGNATLSAELGALAEYAGYFNGNYGLLSTTNKMQDNYYYQDFSYVIKTDVDVASYRDTILELVHPAGMALFGEIAITSNTAVKLFANSARNENSTYTTNTFGTVSQYKFHNITITNQDTGSSNVQVESVTRSTELELVSQSAANTLYGRVESPTIHFDIALESADAIALEGHGDVFILEDDSSGAVQIMQETNEPAYILSESYYDVILLEDGGVLAQENEDGYSRSFLLIEPEEVSVSILSENEYDVFRIQQEDIGDLLILERAEYDDQSRLRGEETSQYAFSLPIIKFPEAETGSAKLDLGPAQDILLEDGDYLLLEDSLGISPKYLALESSMQDEITQWHEVDITLDANNQVSLNYATAVSTTVSNLLYQGTGQIQLTGAENYELLAENNDRLVTESTDIDGTLIIENGEDIYETEQDSGVHLRAIGAIFDSPGAALIAANYGRENEVIGTDTLFETEMANLIVLEDGTGTITLESGTSRDYIIVLENYNNDYIFDGITLEDASGHLSIEGTVDNSINRLVYHDYQDLVVEEENIMLEEFDHVVMEHYTTYRTESTLITESGDRLQLQQSTDIFESEGTNLPVVEYLAQEDFSIQTLTPTLSLEDGGEILIEDYTNDDNFNLIDESGTPFSLEQSTEDQPIQFMREDYFMNSWSEGQVTQSHETIYLYGSIFPHGVSVKGTFIRPDGSRTEIESVDTTNSILTIKNDVLVGETEHNFITEQSTPENPVRFEKEEYVRNVDDPFNYRVEYGFDDTIARGNPSQQERRMLMELNENEIIANPDFFNDYGRNYIFTIGGMNNGNWTIAGLLDRHGNDIIFEDLGSILFEDGELTQHENVILLEDSEKLGYEDSDLLLLEDIYNNDRIRLRDGERFGIKEVANNTSMILTSSESIHTPISNLTFFIERTERITS